MGTPGSRRRLRIQQIFATTLAIPWYSASALEREKMDCHLEDQDIKLPPKKTQYPKVERRVLGKPAQSASV
jgi:hypothetical protein